MFVLIDVVSWCIRIEGVMVDVDVDVNVLLLFNEVVDLLLLLLGECCEESFIVRGLFCDGDD